MPVSEALWKRLQVLPGQTILESVILDFPSVSAETRFLIQWIQGSNQVVGTTEVLGYPTNLLRELKVLAGDEPLGVFDPQNRFKPALAAVGVEMVDLEVSGIARFVGKLAIVGPFANQPEMPEGLLVDIKALANKGAAVVWVQPPPLPREPLKPSFFLVSHGKGTVAVVQQQLVSGLGERPQAQLNLLDLARAASRRDVPGLACLRQSPIAPKEMYP